MPSSGYRCALALVLLALSPAARAQTPGDCDPGQAHAYLSVNDVRARVFNTGSLFYSESTSAAQYFVPKGSGRSPIYAAGLWIGGMVDGQIRVAGSRYDPWEFWPGPLDANGQAPADCAAYDRIWRVSQDDIARYGRPDWHKSAREPWSTR